MSTVIKLFWNICLLRIGPDLVPTHAWFLSTLIVARLTVAVFLLAIVVPALPILLAFNVALISFVVLAAIAWFALYIRHLEPRFSATLGAAAGAVTLIDAVTAVGCTITSGMVQSGVLWANLLWSIVVVGFILHRALASRLWVSILLSLGIALVGYAVTMAALGPALTVILGVPSE